MCLLETRRPPKLKCSPPVGLAGATRTGNRPRESSIAMTSRSLLAVNVPWLFCPLSASAS